MNPIDACGPATPRGPAAPCEATRRRIAGRLDSPQPLLRPADLEHLASCESCRDFLAQTAPESLFSLLVLEKTNEAFWTGFETRVMAEIRERPRKAGGLLGALWRPRPLGLAAAAAAIAAVVLLLKPGAQPPLHAARRAVARGADLVARVSRQPSGAPERAAGVGEREAAENPAPRERAMLEGPLTALGSPLEGRLPGGAHLSPERDAALPAPVESVSSPTARFYTINVEAPGARGSDVVVIVDQGIDI
jgi:hypothetical protein